MRSGEARVRVTAGSKGQGQGRGSRQTRYIYALAPIGSFTLAFLRVSQLVASWFLSVSLYHLAQEYGRMSVLRKATHHKLLLGEDREEQKEGNALVQDHTAQHVKSRASEFLLSALPCVPYCLSLRVFEASLYLCREAFEKEQCFPTGYWNIFMGHPASGVEGKSQDK